MWIFRIADNSHEKSSYFLWKITKSIVECCMLQGYFLSISYFSDNGGVTDENSESGGASTGIQVIDIALFLFERQHNKTCLQAPGHQAFPALFKNINNVIWAYIMAF